MDDHPLVRDALRRAFAREPSLGVCGEAEDREGTMAAIKASKPDLAIVDLRLKDSDGMQLIRDIHDRHPGMLTLVLSMYDEELYAERAIRAGASGYISKLETPEKILQAVQTVLSGDIYWSQRAAAQVASKAARSVRRAEGSAGNVLSERELEVFELIGSGAGTTAIAAILGISASTVETYRARIRQKRSLGDAEQLLQAAIRWNVAKGQCCQLPSGQTSTGKTKHKT